MEIEERIKALEDEFGRAKSETQQLMLDIKALLMEAVSPLRSQTGKSANQNDEVKG
jgi:hypothetical protein